MSVRFAIAALATLMVPLPPPAVAQPAPAASAPAALPRYRSALEGRERLADPPLLPWGESNDLVGRIGGWKAYLREAQGAAPPPASASAPAPGASAHRHSHQP